MKALLMCLLSLMAGKIAGENLYEFSSVIANISKLVADYYLVDCIQLFYSEQLTTTKKNTLFKVWKNTAVVETEITTGIYSYDQYIKRKKLNTRKVSCYRSLKVVADDEQSRKDFAKLMKDLTIKDAVWILYSTHLTIDFFKYANIMFDDQIIIAVIKAKDLVLFYEIYRISENFPIKVEKMGNWTMEGGLVFPSGTLYDRRSDLQGVVLRMASIENWPATYTRKGKWKGFLIKVWNEIQSLMNCTTVSVGAPSDNSIGMRTGNGTWNGLVGMAVRGEIDLLMSEIVIDKERSHVLKFLYPIMKTRFQIYTTHLGYDWQWGAVLKPFHVSVWMASLMWIVVGSLVLTSCYYICVQHGLEEVHYERDFTPVKSFLFIVQALCQQGCSIVPKSYTCRVLVFAAYAVSGVLIPSYSASLVSSLTQKVRYETFDSLKDMVKDGTYHLVVKENSAQHAFFAHAKDQFLKEAYEKLAKNVPIKYKKMGLRQSISILCQQPKYAVMGIEEIVEVRMSGGRKPECPIIHLKYPVSAIHLTIATSKTNPFWGLINHHLGKLMLNGMISRLKQLEFPSATTRASEDKEVGLQQLISAFAFVGAFAVLSVFLLLLEIQYYLYSKAKAKNKRRKRFLQQEQAKIILEYDLNIKKKYKGFP